MENSNTTSRGTSSLPDLTEGRLAMAGRAANWNSIPPPGCGARRYSGATVLWRVSVERVASLATWLVLLITGIMSAQSADLQAYRQVTPDQNRAAKEAPMLAARVARGELPPLAERIPANPLVIPVVDEAGLYGGTWRKFDTTADFLAMRLLNNYYPLTRWKPDSSGIAEGIAESWSTSEDGRSTTFRIRRNTRWSDGTPFTSADILFWWDLCQDDRVIISPPEWAYSSGKRMEVTAEDTHTITFRYAEPFYLLPLMMATGFWVPESVLLPDEYLRQFHPDFNPEYKDFNEMIRKINPVTNPDRPTLGPWMLTEYSGTGDRAVYERNPYYYGVDGEGRQLPYLDRIETVRVQHAEAGVLYTISGAVDVQFRQLSLENYALLKRFAAKANYRITTWEEGTAAWHAVFVNWSVDDSKRRKLFRNNHFRRGLALAIDRERINQVVWNGLGRVQAAAITDESWHFDSPRGKQVRRDWTTRWSQYDPEAAAQHFDLAGLTERDADGFRMLNGKPFEIILDYFDMPYATEEAVLIEADWKAAGIRTLARKCTNVDLNSRVNSGSFDAYMQHNSELDLFTFPGYVFPVDPRAWHPKVGKWYQSGGREGEAPEGFMKTLLDLYETCKQEPDIDRRHGLVLDAIEIQLKHGPWMLGTVGRQKAMVVSKNYVRNLPLSGIMGPWAICQPGCSFPEQIYFSEDKLYGNR